MTTRAELLNKVVYIKQNIYGLSRDNYVAILKIVMNSSIDDSKIQEKGSGVQVKFRDLDAQTIENIYDYISLILHEKEEKLCQITKEK